MAINKGLGRGLGALLNDNLDTEDDKAATIEIPIKDIIRNPEQPRKVFNEDALAELVNSIRVHGVITPIIVVRYNEEKYMIIAGERRFRASRLAGLVKIPAIVRDYNAKQIKEISLIENLQREDLNPIEVADAIRQLMLDYDYTQEQVSDRLGKSRSAVANSIGLLQLDEKVQGLVIEGSLSTGHAKLLTGVNDKSLQYELAIKGINNKMPVRKFEELVKKCKNGIFFDEPKKDNLSLELRYMVERMQRIFATKVSAIGTDNKGRIYIDYYTRDDLDRLSNILDSIEENGVY